MWVASSRHQSCQVVTIQIKFWAVHQDNKSLYLQANKKLTASKTKFLTTGMEVKQLKKKTKNSKCRMLID